MSSRDCCEHGFLCDCNFYEEDGKTNRPCFNNCPDCKEFKTGDLMICQAEGCDNKISKEQEEANESKGSRCLQWCSSCLMELGDQ